MAGVLIEVPDGEGSGGQGPQRWRIPSDLRRSGSDLSLGVWDGLDPVPLFARAVDAQGQLHTGNVPVRDASQRQTPSLNRFWIEIWSKIRY